jgi:predicted DCC family thiol-disulfide oxidoreductase YuxK
LSSQQILILLLSGIKMEIPSEIILFDGVCNFCNSSVQFIMRKEKRAELKFASLQSATGQKLLSEYGVAQDGHGTLVYIKNGKAYTRSSAALRITKKFRGIWPAMSAFLIVPSFIRDFFYNIIARNRYKWWGKSETCQIPSPGQRMRFIDL